MANAVDLSLFDTAPPPRAAATTVGARPPSSHPAAGTRRSPQRPRPVRALRAGRRARSLVCRREHPARLRSPARMRRSARRLSSRRVRRRAEVPARPRSGGRRAVRPPREPGPAAAQVLTESPGYWLQGQHRCRQESKGERAPSGRRDLVGLESAPKDALGPAGRVERLTIQPRKKTHECYSKGNRRPAK